jgi:hypothetical protein
MGRTMRPIINLSAMASMTTTMIMRRGREPVRTG